MRADEVTEAAGRDKEESEGLGIICEAAKMI